MMKDIPEKKRNVTSAGSLVCLAGRAIAAVWITIGLISMFVFLAKELALAGFSVFVVCAVSGCISGFILYAFGRVLEDLDCMRDDISIDLWAIRCLLEQQTDAVSESGQAVTTNVGVSEQFPAAEAPRRKEARAKTDERPPYTVTVSVSRLNVRSKADGNSPVLRVVQSGETFTVVEVCGEWGRLSDNGWINLRFTTKV